MPPLDPPERRLSRIVLIVDDVPENLSLLHDALDEAGLRSPERDALTPDVMLSMALWQAVAQLSAAQQAPDCVPCDAAREAQFEAVRLNELVGK